MNNLYLYKNRQIIQLENQQKPNLQHFFFPIKIAIIFTIQKTKSSQRRSVDSGFSQDRQYEIRLLFSKVSFSCVYDNYCCFCTCITVGQFKTVRTIDDHDTTCTFPEDVCDPHTITRLFYSGEHRACKSD